MKKFITLLILLCTVIGAKAATVDQLKDENDEPIPGFIKLTLESNSGSELQTLSNSDKELLSSAETLIIEGTVYANHFQILRDFGSLRPKTLDLSNAILLQPQLTCTYKDANGNETTIIYSSTDNSFPPIIKVNNVEYKLFYAITDKVSEYQLPNPWKGCLETLYLPDDDNFKIVNEDFCNGFSSLSNVIIPDNVKVIGKNAFRDCVSLNSVDLNNVEFLCEWCFYAAAMPKVTIPGTCVYIGYCALSDQEGHGVIEALVFDKPIDDPDHYMIIKWQAFNNMDKLKDIYINTTSQFVCENEAFSMDITFAHGDAEGNLCSLHFPSDVAEHYSNLSHPLTIDIAKDPALFHNWLLNHYSYAQSSASHAGNGWWEFVNTGTIDPEDDPVPEKKILRTYSDYNYDRIVPRGMKAYIVTGLNSIDDKTYEVSLTQLLVIPKRTGVILYGQANAVNQDGVPIMSLQPVEIANGYPLRRDYWYKLKDEDVDNLKNYLWPTCVANDPNDPESLVNEIYKSYRLNNDGSLQQNSDGSYTVDYKTRTVLASMNEKFSSIGPWDEKTNFTNDDLDDPEVDIIFDPETNQQKQISYNIESLNGFYRNFYLNYYKTTTPGQKDTNNSDFMGFFRAMYSSMSPGHAYLRLKSTEYKNSEGMEVIVNPDRALYKNGDTTYDFESYQVEFNKKNGTPEGPETTGLWTSGNPAQGIPNLIWQDTSNWGERPSLSNLGVLVKFFGEPIIEDEDGHATMIIGPVQDDNAKDPYFYTIQGVRIAKPTAPGIYIHNGKKVVIK